MRGIFIAVILSILCLQYVEARLSKEIKKSVQSTAFENDRDVRGIADTWNYIKNSAKNAWSSVKNIAQNTKDRIQDWIEKVKTRAHDISQKIEIRIKNIRDKSKAVLEKLVGTGHIVKQCFQKENKAIEELLKQIIKYVTSCISDSLLNLKNLEKTTIELQFNDTDFISDLENKINKCTMQKEVEDCLNEVRQDIFLTMGNMENEVLTRRLQARGIADDLLDTIATCSIQGLLDASNVITSESIEIINCVVKANT